MDTPYFITHDVHTQLPHRVLTAQCRTSMAAPSDLGMDLLHRSASVPSWRPYRCILPPPPPLPLPLPLPLTIITTTPPLPPQ